MLAALFVGWAVVDVSDMFYNTFSRHPIYRWANFCASSLLYLSAGSVWQYRGSLAEFLGNLRHLRRPLI